MAGIDEKNIKKQMPLPVKIKLPRSAEITGYLK
jgi:hypothetical protein